MKHRSKQIKHAPPRRAPLPHKRHGSKPPRPHHREETAEATFCGTRHGYGFAVLRGREDEEDVFIPAGKTAGALDGDTVLGAFSAYTGNRREGRVEKIIKSADTGIIGTLASARIRGMRGNVCRYFVIPDNRRLPEEIGVDGAEGAAVGDKVLLVLKGRGRFPYGKIIRSFGPAHTAEATEASILAEAGIIPEFEPEALRLAEKMAALPLESEGRLRFAAPILTMDSESAKDLDDAVSLEKTENGYILSVHIADVSEYVLPKTALDRAAMHRGTSVYFANKVIPMLPPALSNGSCSLNAGEDKYTLSAILTLNEEGKLLKTELKRGIIRSAVRGIYSEINELLENAASPFAEKYAPLYPSLLLMKELYVKREALSAARGCLSIEEAEPTFVFDKNGIPTDIVCRTRGISERMIEQFMLLANEGVATLLHQKGIPCVYRTHASPPEDKLELFKQYLHNLGISPLPLMKEPLSVSAFSEVVKEAETAGKLAAISIPLLRSMAKATYETEPTGHFGLALPLYCHFTSPIRRLSDLATHRIIKAVLLDGESPEKYRAYARRAAAAAAKTELSAVSAERQMNDFYQALWAEGHIGEVFEGEISSILSFGAFVRLSNGCEGLIPLELLPFGAVCNENALTLRIGKETLSISSPVRVTIFDAEPAARKITLSFLSSSVEANSNFSTPKGATV